MGANGAIQVTNTNAYSGNKGRAAILANGTYYRVGNSNNGSGTPTNVITATGVRLATPAAGPAKISVGTGAATQTASNIHFANVAPAIFTVNGSSLATAYAVHVAANGAQTSQPTYTQRSRAATKCAALAYSV